MLKFILTNNTYNKPQKGGCRKHPLFFLESDFLARPQNFYLVEKKYMLGVTGGELRAVTVKRLKVKS